MIPQKYEQKKAGCWEEASRRYGLSLMNGTIHAAFNFAFDRAYSLGKQETKQEIKQETDAEDTVISGWLARDKDGLLNFFYGGSTPYKNDNDGDWNTAFGRVLEYLPREMFPDLTWESTPIEVELIIKRKKI